MYLGSFRNLQKLLSCLLSELKELPAGCRVDKSMTGFTHHSVLHIPAVCLRGNKILFISTSCTGRNHTLAVIYYPCSNAQLLALQSDHQ